MARNGRGKRKASSPPPDAEFLVSDNDQDSESSGEEEHSREPTPPPKRKRTLSAKQSKLHEDNELAEIQRLKNQLARLTRGVKKTSNEKAPDPDDDVESQDEEEMGLAAFQSQSKTSAVIRTDDRGNPNGPKVHRQNKIKSSGVSAVVFTSSIGKHRSTATSAVDPVTSTKTHAASSRSHSEPAPESPVKPVRQRRASSPPMMDSDSDGMDDPDVEELPKPNRQGQEASSAGCRDDTSKTATLTASLRDKGSEPMRLSKKHSEPPKDDQSAGPSKQNTKNVDSVKGKGAVTKNPHGPPVVPPYKNGVQPTGRPKAGDYEDGVNKLIIDAVDLYHAPLFHDGGYMSDVDRVKYAGRCWMDACLAHKVNYTLEERVIRIIKARDSQIRGLTGEALRPVIEDYGFNKKQPAHDNMLVYESLKAGGWSFHYKDIATQKGFAENRIVISMICAVAFASSTDPGIVSAKYFKPITLEFLALIFTSAQFCIEEWATGAWKKSKHNENVEKVWYSSHLKSLEDWRDLNTKFCLNYRTKMYDRCLKMSKLKAPTSASGAGLDEATRKRLAEQLEARTGDTDTEDEIEEEAASGGGKQNVDAETVVPAGANNE